MKMKLAMVALAFFVLTLPASAEVTKHRPSGLQFELPAGWTTRTNAGQLVAEPPDGKTYLSFAVIEEAQIQGYVAKWAEGMKGRLTDLQVDVDGKVDEVNGLQHVYSVGSATLEGKPIHWDLTIVKGGTKVLAVMALGENLDGAAVQKVYASIQRLAPGVQAAPRQGALPLASIVPNRPGTLSAPPATAPPAAEPAVGPAEDPPAEEPADEEPADEEPADEEPPPL